MYEQLMGLGLLYIYMLASVGLVFVGWGLFVLGLWVEEKVEARRKAKERTWNKISNYIL